jgi:predicted RNA polymerase sigma factor
MYVFRDRETAPSADLKFIAAARNYIPYKIPREPLPWLLGVARHKVLNHQRSSRRQDALRLRLMREHESARRSVRQPDEDAHPAGHRSPS